MSGSKASASTGGEREGYDSGSADSCGKTKECIEMRGDLMRNEEKKISRTGTGNQISQILKSLLCAYVLTGILLLILAGLLYKLNLDEGKVTAGIIVIYVLSTFAGGFIAGKLLKERKFLWGLTVGILYFGLLLLVSLGLYRSLQGGGADIMTTFLMCAGGGMLGGMVS